MRLLQLSAALVALSAFSTGAAAQQGKKILVSYTASGDSVGVYVAQEHGLFKKHGLDVELKLIPLNPTIPAALQSNSLQIGALSPPVLLQAVVNGVDLVGIAGGSAASRNSTSYAILVKSDLPISSAKDLVGKRVGVPGVGAALHILARDWFRRQNVDFKDIRFIEVPFAQMNDILRGGTVDAVVTSDPITSRIVGAKTGKVLSYFVQDFHEGMPMQIATATRTWAAENPDVVKGYRAALTEAAAFVRDKPKEARDAIGKYVKLPPEILEGMAIPSVRGELDVNLVQAWVDVMSKQDMLRNPPDAKKFVAD